METVASRYQYRTRLISYTFIIIVLGAAVAGVGIFALLPSELGHGYGDVVSTVQGIASALLGKVTALYLAIAVCIVVAMIFLHLLYSHRVAGPAYRLGLEAAKIGEGNLAGNIRFRRKDNLTDMADSLNQLAEHYRQRVEGVNRQLADLDAQAAVIAELIQKQKNGPALEQAVEDALGRIEKVDAILTEIRS